MKRVTLRECIDGGWSATYEDVHVETVNPISFALGDTQLAAAERLMATCPESKSVAGRDVKVSRISDRNRMCETHGHPLVRIDGTANGDPLVCAECAYRTALSLSLENGKLLALLRERTAALEAIWEAEAAA